MKISIITVVYNNVSQIKKTIDSVLEQTYNDIEYIIIDGDSTDGSVEIINTYSTQLAYWECEKDNGIYHAMNKGWKRATGDYCLFLNSGDYLYDARVIEKVVQKIEENPADIIFGNLFAFDEDKNFVSSFKEPVSLYYFQHSFIPHPATFTRTSLLRKVNGFYEQYKIISDWAFFVNSYLIGSTFKHINVTITSFYMKGSSSNQNIAIKDNLDLFNNEFKFLAEDFKNFERLRHFDTSFITRIARTASSLKMKYFG